MSPVVTTPSGRVQGVEEFGVVSFRGIPYSEMPAGELRFCPPRKKRPWTEILDATQFGAVPFQHRMPGAFGELATPTQPQSFNSLVLNVWTPDLASRGLPVLVWIHGGGFFAGSGSDPIYNGARFARDGVVCVTINYRLGAEGFLHLDKLFEGFENSGCNGIADQVAALEWIQESIGAFGGDPTKVTIAGESAGAFSVATLLATPGARGLFRRAISQSGGANNVVSAAHASHIATVFLSRIGVPPGDLKRLQEVSPSIVVAEQERLAREFTGNLNPAVWKDVLPSTMAFRPVFGTPFLPERPLGAISNGSAKNIDLLIGSNYEETLIYVKSSLELFNEDVMRAGVRAAMATSGKSADELFELYRRNREGAPPYIIAAAIESDRRFRIPSIRLAEGQVALGAAVFMYRFDWQSKAFGGEMGAFHMLEIPFAFDNLDVPQAKGFTGEAPRDLATKMHRAWVSFATNGCPDIGSPPTWPKYEYDRRSTMIFGLENSVVFDPSGDEREIWSNVDL